MQTPSLERDQTQLRTYADLDFGRVLDRLAALTRTRLGEERARVPRLSDRRDRVEHELDLTSEIRGLLDAGERPPFAGITDVRPALEHASKAGYLEPEDLLGIGDTLRGFWLLERFFAEQGAVAARAAAIAARIPPLEGLREELLETFDEKGAIRDEASVVLADLRSKRRRLHERIRERIARMLGEPDIEPHLQDGFFTIREERYVLPVRSGERGDVAGIIHGSSNTGRTLFVEPNELVPINNELKLCEQAVAVEEARILAALTARVGHHQSDILDGLDAAAELDLVVARARLAIEMDAVRPVVGRDQQVRLDQARNPLLLLRRVPVVPNDIIVGGEQPVLIVTGPNAGGKTVTLSTLGLCALMLRSGLHLPVGRDSVMPLFPRVLTVMGDSQDLQADLSTFSGHLRRLSAVLERAQTSSLVLLDELAVGTDPGQGAALAIAVLERLADLGAVSVVTTHYDRLKTLSLEDPRFRNAAVEMDDGRGEPTYRLTIGSPGSSSAFRMARRLGFPSSIVDRAEAIASNRGEGVERILEGLDAERSRLRDERAEALAERQRLQREIREIQAERRRLVERGEELERKARDSALREIDEARGMVRRIVRDLQRDKGARNVDRQREVLERVRETVAQPAAPAAAVTAADSERPALRKEDARPGAEVWVPAFSKPGLIEEIRGSSAVVAIGSMRMTIRLKELQAPRTPAPAPKPRRSHVDTTPTEHEAPPRSPGNTCDVRGQRADDAIREVEQFMDSAMLQNWSVIYVLHGHGTGRLKNALRDYLRASRYVDRTEVPDRDRGGDAVTVVWLR